MDHYCGYGNNHHPDLINFFIVYICTIVVCMMLHQCYKFLVQVSVPGLSLHLTTVQTKPTFLLILARIFSVTGDHFYAFFFF